MAELVESLITQTVSGDTHAAGLAGSNTITVSAVGDTKGSAIALAGGASNVTTAHFSADLGVVDTTLRSLAAITPKTAVNIIHLAATCQIAKITNAGTATLAIKEGAGILFSFTSASLSANTESSLMIDGAVSNATVAAHTYICTLVVSATGVRWSFAMMYGTCIERGGIPSAQVTTGGDLDSGAANSVSVGSYSADVGTTETTVATATAITPSNAKNAIVLGSVAETAKITNNGTITHKIKEGAGTLVSFTSASYTLSTQQCNGIDGTLGEQIIYDQTAASHTYTYTIQASSTGMRWRAASIFVQPVSALSGSDTHAGSLSGSAGSCV